MHRRNSQMFDNNHIKLIHHVKNNSCKPISSVGFRDIDVFNRQEAHFDTVQLLYTWFFKPSCPLMSKQ